ncbi:hypothetical protein [Streptomyces olivochromogenes]|uniref:hypothetical protein n=1 Tax=Streptomyces olivochromogenes TaxID=1963 RepID=UPI001F3592BE|nr:hypothetical protein [Streptomyces olivochromogenes]
MANRSVDPDELPHPLGRTGRGTGPSSVRWAGVGELASALAALPTWPERFDLLDDALLRRPRAGSPGSDRVVRAWSLLRRSWGTVPVPRLAEEVGWSVRHLENRFREQIGLGPKAAARVPRLRPAASTTRRTSAASSRR